MTGTTPICQFCLRPVIGEWVCGSDGVYHPECVRPPQHGYAPPADHAGAQPIHTLTEHDVRRIVREELAHTLWRGGKP